MALNPALMEKLKSSKNKYSRSTNSVKLKEGKTTIRLLQKGTDEFWREIGIHWIKTEKEGKPVAVIGCQDEVYGKPCSVCAAIDEAMKSATDEEKEILKDMRAKKTVLVAALIRSGTDGSETTPVVLELAGTTWNKLSGTIEEYALQEIDALDLDSGIDFVVERTGKGKNTEYNVMVAPRSKPVSKDVLDRLPDLDAYIERELFKEGDRKALTAIGNFAGINVGGLTALAPPRSTTKLLSSTTVEDAVIEEPVADPEIAEIVEKVAAPVESDEDRELREMEEKMAAMKARKEAKAKEDAAKAAATSKPATSKPAPAPKAAPAPAKDAFTGTATDDDIEAMLADLDNA